MSIPGTSLSVTSASAKTDTVPSPSLSSLSLASLSTVVPSSSATASGDQGGNSSDIHTNTALIALVAVFAVLFVAASCAALFFWKRLRQVHYSLSQNDSKSYPSVTAVNEAFISTPALPQHGADGNLYLGYNPVPSPGSINIPSPHPPQYQQY